MKMVKFLTASLLLLGSVLGMKAQAKLSIEKFYIIPGETKIVTIDMENSVDIRALQVLVDLPENVRMVARPSIVAKRQGEFLNEFGVKKSAQKTISYKIRDNGDCMIVVNANDAIPFGGSEGAIIELTLKADESATDCREKIELQDMELVYSDGNTYIRPSDYICDVDICRQTTNIKVLSSRVQGYVDVYTLDGLKIKEGILVQDLENVLPQGVYVIEGLKVLIKK